MYDAGISPHAARHKDLSLPLPLVQLSDTEWRKLISRHTQAV